MISLRNIVRNTIPLANAARNYSSGEKLVNVSVNDKTGIATVTMQRPPVNGLNLELLTGLSNAFDEVDSNNSRGMILTSASDSVFSGGLDIMEMYKPKPERVKAFWTALQDVWLKLYGSAFPTVAVVNGHSPAGGCLLALSCEYRVMVKNFTIGLNETKLGIVAPNWFIASMVNAIGTRHSELALTTGNLFTTDEALKVGLIDEIANDKADGLAKAEQFFKKFAKVHPLARQLTKTALRSKALSASEKIFCAGLELTELYKPERENLKALWLALQDMWLKLQATSFPTAAVINGHAPAAGCLLALSCEYRVMVKNFIIGLNEVQIGIAAPDWLKASLVYTIGARQAELALATGKLLTTQEAFNVGLIDEIANDKADAMTKGEEFFRRFDKVHPLARQLTKTALRSETLEVLMDRREEDVEEHVSLFFQPDVQNSIEGFIQALKK